jgi:hypothetical protein
MNQPGQSPAASREAAKPGSADRRATTTSHSDNPALQESAPESKTPVSPEHEKGGSQERTWGNHPADPNRMGADWNFPPGINPEDVRDPGSQTPGAPPVDNRS